MKLRIQHSIHFTHNHKVFVTKINSLKYVTSHSGIITTSSYYCIKYMIQVHIDAGKNVKDFVI